MGTGASRRRLPRRPRGCLPVPPTGVAADVARGHSHGRVPRVRLAVATSPCASQHSHGPLPWPCPSCTSPWLLSRGHRHSRIPRMHPAVAVSPWASPWPCTLRAPCHGRGPHAPHRGRVPMGIAMAMSLAHTSPWLCPCVPCPSHVPRTHLAMAVSPWASPHPCPSCRSPWLCPHKLLCSPVPMSLAAAMSPLRHPHDCEPLHLVAAMSPVNPP